MRIKLNLSSFYLSAPKVKNINVDNIYVLLYHIYEEDNYGYKKSRF